nr:transcription factor BIM1 isoform X1 [Ipomoea trifida]
MELPQPRAFGTDGRKTTHDFLSLYSPAEQDPRPRQAGGYLRTHDFLQPLEQAEGTVGKEESKVEVTIAEKPPPPPSMEHNLPGGIGTYSISYLQRVPKPEGSLFAMAQPSSTERNDENSNCSSYSGSGFTLWDETAVKKGKTGKENSSGERHVLRETGVNTGGQRPGAMEWPSQSSSNLKHSTAAFSSFSSSQQLAAQNNQSFLNMITSAKSAQEEDEDEDDEEFVIKKEPSPHPKGNLSVKTVGKSNDQKPNTPRSKHSATEQRRRSKINDRFQMLRDIIPHSDQKRDKASFLLEVIEYIQFLQEKVQKHEGSYQSWEHEPTKLPWNNCQRGAQGFIDQSQGTNNASDPALIFASKFADSKPGISRTIPVNGQKAEPDMSTALIKDGGHQQPMPLPFDPNIFPLCGTRNIASQPLPKLVSGKDKSTSQHQPQFPQSRSNTSNYTVASNEPKDQDPTIESGTISISSIYSQGLLSTLTTALQSSGVDLSQASISVHIDLGKRANGRLNSSASTIKGDDVSTSNQPIPHSLVTSAGDESSQALKRIKTS